MRAFMSEIGSYPKLPFEKDMKTKINSLKWKGIPGVKTDERARAKLVKDLGYSVRVI